MSLLIEALGWIAAALTFAAYFSRTMLPLRVSAVGANLFFISYGALTQIYPVLVLHLLLLPLNAYRLWEIVDLRRRAVAGTSEKDAFKWIAHLAKPRDFASGTTLFARGDPADHLYYIVSGKVRIAEIDKVLEAGEIFGEIAFFADPRERTATAICAAHCEIVLIDERRFMDAFHQDPSFGLAIVRLVASRLIENARGSMVSPADAPIPAMADAGHATPSVPPPSGAGRRGNGRPPAP